MPPVIPQASPDAIARSRQGHYLGKPRIQEFQRTLSCPHNDALAAAGLLRQALRNRAIEVLDYGGGDGRFTANLLNELKKSGVSVSELRMCDPVDWGAEYASEHGASPTTKVEHFHTVADAVRNDKFDLIIASHSLYSLLDARKGTEPNPIDELRAALKPRGALLVILASGRSHAYAFKSAALTRLFGIDPNDAIAEDVGRGERHASAASPDASESIDNVIDLTELIGLLDAGRPERLHEWLSYFLRVDIRGIQLDAQLDLEYLLMQHVISFSAVPVCLQRAHTSGRAVVVKPSSLVLLHRTVAFLWRSK